MMLIPYGISDNMCINFSFDQIYTANNKIDNLEGSIRFRYGCLYFVSINSNAIVFPASQNASI